MTQSHTPTPRKIAELEQASSINFEVGKHWMHKANELAEQNEALVAALREIEEVSAQCKSNSGTDFFAVISDTARAALAAVDKE